MLPLFFCHGSEGVAVFRIIPPAVAGGGGAQTAAVAFTQGYGQRLPGRGSTCRYRTVAVRQAADPFQPCTVAAALLGHPAAKGSLSCSAGKGFKNSGGLIFRRDQGTKGLRFPGLTRLRLYPLPDSCGFFWIIMLHCHRSSHYKEYASGVLGVQISKKAFSFSDICAIILISNKQEESLCPEPVTRRSGS